jgi:hypothetical protein
LFGFSKPDFKPQGFCGPIVKLVGVYELDLAQFRRVFGPMPQRKKRPG